MEAVPSATVLHTLYNPGYLYDSRITVMVLESNGDGVRE
jgi:hypothetical protein